MKKLIYGNFKMNVNFSQFKIYAKTLCDKLISRNEVGLALPYTHLSLAKDFLPSDVCVGAQNLAAYESGAYTGEISADILADLNTHFVLIGHSERRWVFNESEDDLLNKVKLAIKYGVKVMLCVGEKVVDGNEFEFIKNQLDSIFENVDYNQNIVIAYEPVYSIGTGKVPTLEDIENKIKFIKNYKNLQNAKVLYGGSVNEKNCKEILSIKNVDGLLIGGACLDAEKFAFICNNEY